MMVLSGGMGMFKKAFIKQHLIEYASFDLALLFYIFQFFFYVNLFGHPLYQMISVFFIFYFLFTPIILFRLKSYRDKTPITRFYVDLYFVVSLSMLLIVRIMYSTLLSIKWPVLFIPFMLVLLIIYRVLIFKKIFESNNHQKIFMIFSIILNVISLVGLFVHMMFFQG